MRERNFHYLYTYYKYFRNHYKNIQLLLTITLLFLAACSSVETKEEYTRQFDFTEIMTYTISKEQGSQYSNTIKEAVNVAMAHKGFGINDKQYDFIINWNLQSDGSLNIELYDPQNMDIIWRGSDNRPHPGKIHKNSSTKYIRGFSTRNHNGI